MTHLRHSVPFVLALAMAAAGGSGSAASAAGEPLVPFFDGEAGPLAQARLEGAPCKPYVKQLATPAGLGVLDDSPPDHFHHHGLMFALGVGKTDFWAEKGQDNIGTQQPVATSLRPGRDGAAQTLRWMSHEGRPLLVESRAIRVLADREPAVNWLVWRSRLAPADGVEAVELNGHHYYGLGMRFVPAFAGASRFAFLGGGEARGVRGDERLTPGRACAATARVEGKPVTVVVFDHKDNPRPALWFTMGTPFAYVSATQGLMDKPQQLAKGQSWSLSYGVACIDGEADESRLAALEKRWQAIAALP